MQILSWALISGLLCTGIGADVQLRLRWLNQEENANGGDSLAVCNDGTSAAYYIVENDQTDEEFKDMWLFDLQEGGQCYSKDTCDSRDISMKSSSGYTDTLSLAGIFDDDKSLSPFSGANKVFLPYCSSDGWIGDAPAGELTWGYEFRGQRIIRSVIQDLVAQRKITSSSSIMFSGQSAGGRGVMNNVDFLSEYLPDGVTILGAILDSPYYIDVQPYDENFVGFQNQTKEIYNRYNVGAIIPDDCAEKYPNSTGEGWKCLYGQYRIPFVRTPFLLIASQYDSYQLGNNMGVSPVNGQYETTAMNDYALMFGERTAALLNNLHTTVDGTKASYSHIFSWACYNHAVSRTSQYYTLTNLNYSENDASAIFINSAVNYSNVDSCTGLFCGTGCQAY